MDLYLREKPLPHPEMLKVVFDTAVAMKIMRERLFGQSADWKMAETKGYVVLKREHLLDELAVDRIIESIEVIYK